MTATMTVLNDTLLSRPPDTEGRSSSANLGLQSSGLDCKWEGQLKMTYVLQGGLGAWAWAQTLEGPMKFANGARAGTGPGQAPAQENRAPSDPVP